MITELVCTAVAVGLYLNTLDADFCYDDRYVSPTERSSAAANNITARSYTCHLLRLRRHGREAERDGWLLLSACLHVLLSVACDESPLICRLKARHKERVRGWECTKTQALNKCCNIPKASTVLNCAFI